MSTQTKEAPKKRAKRKAEEIPEVPVVVVPPPAIIKKEEPTKIVGLTFCDFFSWDSLVKRDHWNAKGPGLFVFQECELKTDVGHYKKGEKVGDIIVDFLEGKIEFVKSFEDSIAASLCMEIKAQ